MADPFTQIGAESLETPAGLPQGDWVSILIVGGLLLVGLGVYGPIPQDPEYHAFADGRKLLGIPNTLDVLSNLPFLVTGGIGLWVASRARRARALLWTLFVGVVLTGVGSAFYHLRPTSETLVWDRLPMTIVFMSILTLVIGRVSERWARRLVVPLLGVGVASVVWWWQTDDLRAYAFVQFFPMLVIPWILIRSRGSRAGIGALVGAAGAYGVAKVLEAYDHEVWALGTGVSGHTLKHLAAAVATAFLVGYARVLTTPAPLRRETPVRRRST